MNTPLASKHHGPTPAAAAHALPAGQGTLVARAAVLALHDELALAPKPGLVSFADSGSHDDMDAQTFLRSLMALRGYFGAIHGLGAQGAPFAALERCGIAAEATMLQATQGINTHRGAIFILGLLCAAVGRVQAHGGAATPEAVRDALRATWGAELAERAQRTSQLPGGVAARRWGLRSASEEAALAFPAVFEVGLPAWRQAQSAGWSHQQVQAQAFFALLGQLDDCNLAHRGGLKGLHWARAQAHGFLAVGGAGAPGWEASAWALHRRFVARRLSPGGCADGLSALCFLQRVGRIA
ncbi:triphosphoribosyl-dephospho-CoA synthase [Sphaerotilus microaerophilus]|nr:triphosphoribosyl-dephospho-CoA synthase [Sphaerotilus sp. FB-5]